MFKLRFGPRRTPQTEQLSRIEEDIKKLAAQPVPVRFTELTPFDESDPRYIDELARIGKSQEFRFFLYQLRDTTVRRLEELPANEAELRSQITGELKAFAKIQAYFENAIATQAAR